MTTINCETRKTMASPIHGLPMTEEELLRSVGIPTAATINEDEAMDDVIARLRASKIDEDSERADWGLDAGRDWAKDSASWYQLKRLAKAGDDPEEFAQSIELAERNRITPGWMLFPYINPPEKGCSVDCRDFKDFWESAIGDDWEELIEHAAYIKAFVAGAIEIWEQVADEL